MYSVRYEMWKVLSFLDPRASSIPPARFQVLLPRAPLGFSSPSTAFSPPQVQAGYLPSVRTASCPDDSDGIGSRFLTRKEATQWDAAGCALIGEADSGCSQGVPPRLHSPSSPVRQVLGTNDEFAV
jgi:hypothetical protein